MNTRSRKRKSMEALEIHPEAITKGATDPEAITKGATDPEAINKGATDPEAINKGATDPEAINNREVDPEVINKGETDPEAVTEKENVVTPSTGQSQSTEEDQPTPGKKPKVDVEGKAMPVEVAPKEEVTASEQ